MAKAACVYAVCCAEDHRVIAEDFERRPAGRKPRQGKVFAEDMRARDARQAIDPIAGKISRLPDAAATEHIPIKRDHQRYVFCDQVCVRITYHITSIMPMQEGTRQIE